MGPQQGIREVGDLTTAGCGIHPDAQALVYRAPSITKRVPGTVWTGQLKTAKGPADAVIRMPHQTVERQTYDWRITCRPFRVRTGYAFI